MAQKDKVKELVGRSLNSYHTKALQQIERIEKKNKEQNHKINILTGELDKDYITKTAEGSVISLDHSKEGMVYLNELQGNTLVNYCTDGFKETTLNGDIDVEGTSVTTTEGVNNGKIDVMCEGNTLVNLYKSSIPKFSRSDAVNNNTNSYNITTNNNYIKVVGKNLQTSNYRYIYFDIAKLAMLKPNTKYTIIFKKCKVPSLTKCTIQRGDSLSNISNNIPLPNGSDRLVLTTRDTVTVDSQGLYIWNFVNDTSLDIEIELVGIIEGDYTNKEIPSKYFEGMKSVGQDDENTHKIEILSNNKNILSPVKGKKHPFFIKKGTKLVLSEKNNTPSLGGNVKLIDINGNVQWFAIDAGVTTPRYTTTNNDIYCIENALGGDLEYQVEIGTTRTPYVPYAMNKKEILINEPLRSLPNGIKDKFVKIGNKWFVERNCKVQILDGSEGWRLSNTEVQFICNQHRTDALGNTNIPIVCDKIKTTTHIKLDNAEDYGINLSYYLRINLKDCDARNGATVEQFVQKLQDNPVTVVYPLKTPTYEPLEIEPTLNTYTDITHISNDSLIPCNMKIQNTGYNATIKPSTLYTVAVDTNKGGTIGMNLGGVKGTTTNNVLKLTTPATLTDDSLRLYGKGIKGSKVRLLEGDKTNWIPSHFEGMKSSFEDKFDATDNTYKMEILSNNINLVDYENIGHKVIPTNEFTIKGDKITLNSSKTYQALYYHIPVKRGEDYIVSCKNITNGNVLIYDTKVQGHHADKYKLSIGKNTVKARITPKSDYITLRVSVETMVNTDCTFEQLMMHRANVSSEFKFNKFNKIQFSSIEPLRSTKDTTDKVIFKDGKLMIERNCIEKDLSDFNFSTTEIKGLNLKGGITISDAYRQPQGGANTTMKCDKLASDFKEDTIPCINIYHHANQNELRVSIPQRLLKTIDKDGINDYFVNNPHKVIYRLAEPYYEEIPFELQKIILEGYENGTLFFDTNIPPTSTVTYAGETPIVKATKINKTEVSNNTADINDNILPYLMDMDYRIVMLQLATEELEGEVSMARLFRGTYEMLKRDILSKRLSRQEYGYRLADYFNAGKLTEEQVRELEELR